MTTGWDHSLLAFSEAADHLLHLVEATGDRWDQPGLGEWDVRALVGHTTRALLTVETYLDRRADVVDVAGPADYFVAARSIAGGPEVTERGREAGRALGPDPVGAVRRISERVRGRLADCDGTEVVTTIVGGMRLRDYLPTRTFELTVHGVDLAVALGEPSQPPASAATQALRIVEQLAVDDGSAGTVLVALTGRAALPAGFTLL